MVHIDISGNCVDTSTAFQILGRHLWHHESHRPSFRAHFCYHLSYPLGSICGILIEPEWPSLSDKYQEGLVNLYHPVPAPWILYIVIYDILWSKVITWLRFSPLAVALLHLPISIPLQCCLGSADWFGSSCSVDVLPPCRSFRETKHCCGARTRMDLLYPFIIILQLLQLSELWRFLPEIRRFL